MKIKTYIAVTLLSLSIASCEKAADSLFDDAVISMARENALAQGAFDDVLKVSENILMNNADAKTGTIGAPLGCITNIDSAVLSPTTKKYTIHFDPACTSYDGKVRGGILYLELEGTNFNTAGSKLTITFTSFAVNTYQLTGKMVVLNESNNQFKVLVTDETGTGRASIYITEKSKPMYWRTLQKRTLYEGANDNILINNKYNINLYDESEVAISGMTTKGQEYEAVFTKDLTLDYSCSASAKVRYPTSGAQKFTLVYLKERNLDYGSLSCDNQVTMSWAGVSSTFNLY